MGILPIDLCKLDVCRNCGLDGKNACLGIQELKKYRELIIAGFLIMIVIIISFGVTLENDFTLGDFTLVGGGVHIIWFVLPVMAWALVLIFRPGQSLMKGFSIIPDRYQPGDHSDG